MSSNDTGSEKQKHKPNAPEICSESLMNLTLIDPPRWGWTALGGVADLLTPHERSRRRSTCLAYRKQRRRRPTTEIPNSFRINPSLKVKPAAISEGPGISESVAREAAHPVSINDPQQSVAPALPQIGESSENPAIGGTTTALPTGIADGNFNGIEKAAQEKEARNGMTLPERFVKMGVGSQFWGMSVGRALRDGKNELSSHKNSTEVYECGVESLKDGVLDFYSYHRGREGMEPRNPENSELLCPLEPTDTNPDFDTPKLAISISVEFPLEDEIDTRATDKNGMESTRKAMYRESLNWDLSDPSTPSPLSFASEIANEYGLTFGQMMDLALSIEKQIESQIEHNSTYKMPLSTKDPVGNERRFVGPTIHTHRYGRVLQVGEGGVQIFGKKGATRQARMPIASSKQHATTSRESTSFRRKSFERVYETILGEPEEEIEDEFLNETKKRTKAASVLDISKKCKNGTIGVLEKKLDFHCHICHKRSKIAYSFACGIVSHSYCENHCKTRLGIGDDPASPCVLNYCPICSLHCTCSKCNRKLQSVARAFKSECKTQGTKVGDTKFNDVLERCVAASATRGMSRSVVAIRRVTEESSRAGKPPVKTSGSPPSISTKIRKVSAGHLNGRRISMVPKPPVLAFPREVCGQMELEPGTADDYLKVYTSEGTYLVDDFPEVWSQQEKMGEESVDSPPSKDEDVVEDGNVDHCYVCKGHGNLLCCDFCPRAFHVDCLGADKHLASDAKWECHVCKKEREGIENDYVDGKKSLDKICSSYLQVDASNEKVYSSMAVLGMIHEMLLKLMEYDFGYMFSKPVDCDAVPGYKELVKHPMDLGTICEKLINGGYCKFLEERNSFDDVITAVLKAIELVWHNCYTFNFDGSAIYRMADVQRRRARAMQDRSFGKLLSDQVKIALEEYIKALEVERGQTSTQASNPIASLSSKEKALWAQRPKSKHKITLKVSKPGVNRPVAILDPVSGRVIKIYSTMKTAGQAVQSLLRRGHQCEWPAEHDFNIKAITHRGSADPTFLLFGYRWLMLDDLRSGKVEFAKLSMDIVEMRHKNCKYVFMSIDEAISYPDLPKKVKLEQLRQQLAATPRGSAWTELFGRTWRRPSDVSKASENIKNGVKIGLVSKVNGESALLPSSNDCMAPTPLHDAYFCEHCTVLKEDLVTRRKLIGFETFNAAFDDWIQTGLSSPTFPESEPKTAENFQRFYLDGDRNIDGMVWRIIKDSTSVSDSRESKLKGFTQTSVGIQKLSDETVNSSTTPVEQKGKTNVKSQIISATNAKTIEPAAHTSLDDTMQVGCDNSVKQNAATSRKRKRVYGSDDLKEVSGKTLKARGRNDEQNIELKGETGDGRPLAKAR